MIISENSPPNIDRMRFVHEVERSADPWHANAFPSEFRSRAPNQGEQRMGWDLIDWCGNVIGWIADGTEMPD
jgi:hypothetical protein